MSTKKLSQTISIIGVLIIASLLFLAGSYLVLADWQNAPSSAPSSNTAAPINIESTYQKKDGDLGATRMRSTQYCNLDGTECFTHRGSLETCSLQYRWLWNQTATPWQSVSLDGQSNVGAPSVIVYDSLSSEACRGDGCGPQMRVVCEGSAIGDYRWVTGPWSDWTHTVHPTCPGITWEERTRSVQCYLDDSLVSPALCGGSSKPASVQTRNYQTSDCRG